MPNVHYVCKGAYGLAKKICARQITKICIAQVKRSYNGAQQSNNELVLFYVAFIQWWQDCMPGVEVLIHCSARRRILGKSWKKKQLCDS